MRLSKLLLLSIVTLPVLSCTRNTIEFGTIPENNYTHLAMIDTVNIKLSTVLTDSFATGGASAFLLGRYKDPWLGTVSTRSFFQVDPPSTLGVPDGAIYDSLQLIIRPNDYYYGDTTRPQTITVYELSQAIVTSYADKIYNTSNVPVKPAVLGTRTVIIRPVTDDSVAIRLSDTKGMEIFTKLQQHSGDLVSRDNFVNYFKGISLAVGNNDTAAVYGLGGNIQVRLHYHTTFPYEEKQFSDFPVILNEFAFNQVLADRPGTGIVPGMTGITELASAITNNYSYSQPGTGLALKLSFPSLRNILLTNKYVKLLKAELILRPAQLSFDRGRYRLPNKISLAYTDATNIPGAELIDSSGTGVMYADPFIDDVYGKDTHYRFNVTAYISLLMNTEGVYGDALYINQDFEASSPNVDRLILGTIGHPDFTCSLRLSVLIVNE